MEMSEVKRIEFVFVYDVKDANPNGDPAEGDRPRMDDYTEQNIVSDVRIKRTVRDYVDKKYEDKETMKVFIKEYKSADGTLKTKQNVVENILKILSNNGASKLSKDQIKNGLLRNYWDLRIFGALIDKIPKKYLVNPPKGNKEVSITVTGPVQLRFGRSLHKVEPKLIPGTTVMPSGEGKEQGTFTECWKVPYSLIATYAVVNNHVAQEVELTRKDVGIFWEALWNGTADLNTRSKMGHTPRLLIIVEYKEDHHTGHLDYLIRMFSKDGKEITARADEQGLGKSIRGPDEYYVDLSNMFKELEQAKSKIEKIWVIKHPDLDVRNIPQWEENQIETIETRYINWQDDNLKEFGKYWGVTEG